MSMTDDDDDNDSDGEDEDGDDDDDEDGDLGMIIGGLVGLLTTPLSKVIVGAPPADAFPRVAHLT